MVCGSSTMGRIKNQPSNFTSCSDNCTTLVDSCAERSILRTSSDVFSFNPGLHFEGLFWERCILKGQIAPTWACFGDFQVGFGWVAFTHGHSLIYQAMICWMSLPQMPYYSSILPSVFVDGAPCVFIAKTKSNPSQEREATLLEVLHSCLMSRYRWEGRCLRLKTSTFKAMPHKLPTRLGTR